MFSVHSKPKSARMARNLTHDTGLYYITLFKRVKLNTQVLFVYKK